MSEEFEDQESPPARKGKATLVIALTIGMVGGAAIGSFVVGPLVATAPKSEAGAAECSCEEEAHAVAPVAVHTIENIVINPANSGGTRFLMASVGFGLADAHGTEQMELRDAEVRDVVVRVLGSKTVDQLSDLQARAAIKEEMRAEVIKIVGEHALVDVYFSQFVIQ